MVQMARSIEQVDFGGVCMESGGENPSPIWSHLESGKSACTLRLRLPIYEPFDLITWSACRARLQYLSL